MQIDLIGRVRNTKLGARYGLLPMFEAVVNSIHSIQDAKRADGEITLVIKRIPGLFGPEASGNVLADIQDFRIIDNGIGFDRSNYESFETMDSRLKAARGGKGVGRLLWLKAFEYVEVDSVYQEAGAWRRRHFEFRQTTRGIENARDFPLHEAADLRTEVRLIGFRPQYREASPKSAEAIGRHLVEHCLEYYLLGGMPRVLVQDSEYRLDLQLEALYEAEFRPESQSRSFAVNGQNFTLVDVLIRSTADTQHALKFCAHNRAVQSVPLASEIPHLQGPLRNEQGEALVYQGYVTGPVLDERVDPDRTSFDLDHRGELALAAAPLTWEDLVEGALQAVGDFLGPLTQEAREEAFRRVERFIDTQEPQYKPLLGHRRSELERLPANLSDDRLDAALHGVLSTWRQEVREHATKQLGDVAAEPGSFEAHREEFVRVLGELQDVAKADLAQYVVHRATVLTFYAKLLGAGENGRFEREEALHSLFFPMRTTSDRVDFDDHNLWLLDERLAYHRYLASDLRLSKQRHSPVEATSEDRPDLLIYNTPHAFAPGEAPFASVVVVEFKRPDRTEYRQEDSPLRQVLRYVQAVRDGKARRADGSTLEPLPEHIPFYCHVVATLTEQLRAEAREMGYTEAPDRTGFFHYNQNYRAFIELSSYRKVLEDARKRNKAFFEKLQLRLPGV
jgi:hypothetical protein